MIVKSNGQPGGCRSNGRPCALGLAGGGTDVSPLYSDDFRRRGAERHHETCTLSPTSSCSPEEPGDLRSVGPGQAGRVSNLEESIPNSGETGAASGNIQSRHARDYNEGRPMALRITTHSDAPHGLGARLLLRHGGWRSSPPSWSCSSSPLGEYDVAALGLRDIERSDHLGMPRRPSQGSIITAANPSAASTSWSSTRTA